MWTSMESEHSVADVSEHIAIVDALLVRFEARAPEETQADRARAALIRIRTLINSFQDGSEQASRARLSRSLLVAMQQFGPPL
jgi:hypothetical protein